MGRYFVPKTSRTAREKISLPQHRFPVTKERKKMTWHPEPLRRRFQGRRARRVVAPAAAQGPSLPSTSSRCVRCRDTHASASPPQKRGRRRFSSGQRTRPPSARSRCRAASAAVHTTSTALCPPLCAASSSPPAAAGRLFCKLPCLRFTVVECPAGGVRWALPARGTIIRISRFQLAIVA